MKQSYLAIDLGAESGRMMLGTVDNGKLALEELHRFPNQPLTQGDELHWNVPMLFQEIQSGLRKAASFKIPITSISADSWGLDYVLFDGEGEVIPPTFHYRDPRTARGVERVRATVPWEKVFDETGIQFMPFNTIHQLAAESSGRLARAKLLLPVADAINFQLSGVARAEESLASTTQLYNPRTRKWSRPLLQALGLPPALFPEIVPSGTRLGKVKAHLAHAAGLEPFDVIAGCSHDTAAAVAAIPATGNNWAYVSSGTWSLMGAELEKPLLTEHCRNLNFTNEIGFGGTVRLLKNIIGLWIVQECRRAWARSGDAWDYETLMRMATAAPPFVALINPDDPRFIPPGDMPGRIAGYCRDTGQAPPRTPGETIRCVLESLAMLYRRTFQHLEELTGAKLQPLHIVGGGSRNDLLNQFTADALRIPVLAGPVEATAVGNIIVQAMSAGQFGSLREARLAVANSFKVTSFTSQSEQTSLWNEHFSRWKQLG